MILCILILCLGLASLLINKRPLHILTAVLLPLPALVSFLLLVFSTSYRAQILWGLGVFLILLWYPAVFLRKHGKVVLRIACLATALCLLSSGALYGMERYRESITLREAQDLLDRYAPYGEDSLVARLDAPPTLRLEEPLPRMDGATALYPIYSAFARALYPEEQIEGHLLCSTTTGAWDAIVRGDADIIFTAAPNLEQLQEAEDRGVTLNFTPIGKEAFVFFVNAKNPIEGLTLAQVRSIYAGETTQWTDLDVPSLGRIRAFQREPGSGSQSALIRLMGDAPLMTPPTREVAGDMGASSTPSATTKTTPAQSAIPSAFILPKCSPGETSNPCPWRALPPREKTSKTAPTPFPTPFTPSPAPTQTKTPAPCWPGSSPPRARG